MKQELKYQRRGGEDKAKEWFALIGMGAVMYLALKAVIWVSWLIAYVFNG